MTNPIENILFDAGGTLVFLDCARVARVLNIAHLDGVPRLAQSWYHAVFAYDELLLAQGANGSGPVAPWAWFWNRMTESAGLGQVTEEASHRLMEENQARSLWDQTNDEVHMVLEYLGRRYRLGVVSNSDGSVRATLGRLGLDRWLSVIVDSHVVGVSKPDPRIFDHALGALRSHPSRTVFIGDSYAMDAVGAMRAGIHPILLDPGGLHAGRGVERIRSLGKLCEMF